MRRGAFEQSTASRAEKRIAAKQQAVAEVDLMAQCVARHGDHIERELGARHLNAITIANTDIHIARTRIAAGNDTRVWKCSPQLRYAVDVIEVMMGKQDGGKVQRLVTQRLQRRRSLAGINQHAATGMVSHQPDVVVAECGNGLEVKYAHQGGDYGDAANWPG